MKTAALTLLTTTAMTSAARAAGAAPSEGAGLLVILFLAFAAAILVFQFVPAIALFATMIYGLFSPARRQGARDGVRERA